MQADGDETGDVRHIDHQRRADFVGDLAERSVFHRARVRARAGDQHLRTMFQRGRADFVEIDQLGLFIHAVRDRVVELA